MRYIPLAALAGVLAVVAWNMIEKPAIAILLRSGWGEAAVLLVTFALTVFRDLTQAIVTGLALGSVLFIQRMSQATGIQDHTPLVAPDLPDAKARPDAPQPRDVVVYRISGALFFGATASIGSVLDNIHDGARRLVVDFSAVPFLDATGANMIEGLAHKAHRRGVELWLTGTRRDMRRLLLTHGLRRPLAHYAATVEDALQRAAPRPGQPDRPLASDAEV